MSTPTQTVRNVLIIKRLTAFSYLLLFLKHELALFKWLMFRAASGVRIAPFDVQKIIWTHSRSCGHTRLVEMHVKTTESRPLVI